jgi:hypothetical protein
VANPAIYITVNFKWILLLLRNARKTNKRDHEILGKEIGLLYSDKADVENEIPLGGLCD